MVTIYYEVHSDKNENNIYQSFEGRGAKSAAIKYAKDNKDEQTWVDRVGYDEESGEYEYFGCVWNYFDEDYDCMEEGK